MVLVEGHGRANNVYRLDVQGNVRRTIDDLIIGQVYEDWGDYYFKPLETVNGHYASMHLKKLSELLDLI